MRPAPKVSEPRQPKILLIDIETAPILGVSWGLYQTDVLHVLEPTYILSFAYQWLGQSKVRTKALCDYPGYKTNNSSTIDLRGILSNYEQNKAAERKLVKDLWGLLDEAEIVVAHNGDAFDIKKIQARFVVHGLLPPSPFKSVDTLKISRRHFKFDSNKLDNVGGYVGVGRKLPHTGKHLWLGCMSAQRKPWRKMKEYNAHDIRLLLGVYDKIKAWSPSHPVMTAYAPKLNPACPTCLSERVEKRGWDTLRFKKAQRFHCLSDTCGRWFRGQPITKKQAA